MDGLTIFLITAMILTMILLFRKNNKKELNLTQKLRNQADEKNSIDLKSIITELNEASLSGEYSRTIQLKVNQVLYLQSIGLTVENSERFGFYKISW